MYTRKENICLVFQCEIKKNLFFLFKCHFFNLKDEIHRDAPWNGNQIFTSKFVQRMMFHFKCNNRNYQTIFEISFKSGHIRRFLCDFHFLAPTNQRAKKNCYLIHQQTFYKQMKNALPFMFWQFLSYFFHSLRWRNEVNNAK